MVGRSVDWHVWNCWSMVAWQTSARSRLHPLRPPKPSGSLWNGFELASPGSLCWDKRLIRAVGRLYKGHQTAPLARGGHGKVKAVFRWKAHRGRWKYGLGREGFLQPLLWSSSTRFGVLAMWGWNPAWNPVSFEIRF